MEVFWIMYLIFLNMETNLVFRNESGVAVTTSFLVAETFGKEHKHVIRNIEDLLTKIEVTDN